MKKELRFAFYAIQKNIESSAELRTSFWTNIFGMIINNSALLLMWIFLIQTAGVIGGWTQAHIFGLQGMVSIAFGIVYSLGAGLREIPRLVSIGVFDQFLVSPKNLLVRVATSSFGAGAAGDLLFGIICVTLFLIMISASPVQIIIALLLILTAVITFAGTIISIHSLSFYFTDSDSVIRGIFELFFTPTLLHGGAFQGTIRFVFTFIVPSLLIGTLPIEAIVHPSLEKILLLILLALLWFIFSIWFFYISLKRYESSNFMTFGS